MEENETTQSFKQKAPRTELETKMEPFKLCPQRIWRRTSVMDLNEEAMEVKTTTKKTPKQCRRMHA